MANADHLRKLSEGPKAWNAWRASHPDIIPDLAGADFTLHQRQFGPSNGGPVNFRAANLEGATLRHATLTDADLEAARLSGADLAHARLNGARLRGADLRGAMLDHADLTDADCKAAVINGANLAATSNLTQTQINDTWGDAHTILPPTLTRPDEWSAADDDAFWAHLSDKADPYHVLRLPRSAELDEVRAAYRKLAKRYHPDVNQGNPEAERRFTRVKDAYEAITNPTPAPTIYQRRFYENRTAAAGLFVTLLIAPSLGIYWFARTPSEAPGKRGAPAQTARQEPAVSPRAEGDPLVTGSLPLPAPSEPAGKGAIVAEDLPAPSVAPPQNGTGATVAGESVGASPAVPEPPAAVAPAVESAALDISEPKPLARSAAPTELPSPPPARNEEAAPEAAPPVADVTPPEPIRTEEVPLPRRSAALDARKLDDSASGKPQSVFPPAAPKNDKMAWDLAVIAGTKEAFEAYLRDFPKGRYATLARVKLAAFKGGRIGPPNRDAAAASAKAQPEAVRGSNAAYPGAQPAGRAPAEPARKKIVELEPPPSAAPPAQSRIPQPQQSRPMRFPTTSDEPFAEPISDAR